MAGRGKRKRRRKTNAEFAEGAEGAEGAEKTEDVTAGCEAVDWLPRSLHSVAGAPRTARRKKPATPVGMTG